MDFDAEQFLDDVLERAINQAERANYNRMLDATRLVHDAIEHVINYTRQDLAKLAQRNLQAMVDGVETRIRDPRGDLLSIRWKTGHAPAPGTEECLAFEQELSREAQDTDSSGITSHAKVTKDVKRALQTLKPNSAPHKLLRWLDERLTGRPDSNLHVHDVYDKTKQLKQLCKKMDKADKGRAAILTAVDSIESRYKHL